MWGRRSLSQSYLAILRRHPRVIAFGFFATFFSNFGQTFFIGLYASDFRQALGLDNAAFGSVYSGVTLASAGALLLLGHLVDKVRLRYYAAYACIALGVGCLLMAHATLLPLFVFGLWLVRFHGQGVMTHMSATVTAREIAQGRGRALSLTVLGQPLGEVIFPPLVALLATLFLWQQVWTGFGLVYLLLALPLMLWLAPGGQIALPDALDADAQEDAKLHQVLRDPSLWLLLLGNALMPFAITGIFFHQQWIMDALGFSPALYALSVSVFGIGHAVSGLLAGAVVDRVGAVRVLRWFLLPFILALLLLLHVGQAWVLPLFMLATALTAGCTHSARGSYLAERYGTGKLGAIKSLFSSSMVFFTALSPALFGWLIDAYADPAVLFYLCGGLAAVVMLALRLLKGGRLR